MSGITHNLTWLFLIFNFLNLELANAVCHCQTNNEYIYIYILSVYPFKNRYITSRSFYTAFVDSLS